MYLHLIPKFYIFGNIYNNEFTFVIFVVFARTSFHLAYLITIKRLRYKCGRNPEVEPLIIAMSVHIILQQNIIIVSFVFLEGYVHVTAFVVTTKL